MTPAGLAADAGLAGVIVGQPRELASEAQANRRNPSCGSNPPWEGGIEPQTIAGVLDGSGISA